MFDVSSLITDQLYYQMSGSVIGVSSGESSEQAEDGVPLAVTGNYDERPPSPMEYKLVQGLDGQIFMITTGLEADGESSELHVHHQVMQHEDGHLEISGLQEIEIGDEESQVEVTQRPQLSNRDPLDVGTLQAYETTIESVIRNAAQTVTDAELKEFYQRRRQSHKPPSKQKPMEVRDPLQLPFQYSGQSFNVQSQKLILNVMHFLKEHRRDSFIESVKTPQEKAARLLNISSSVIGKIRKNFQIGKLEQPGKMRQMTKRVLDKVSTQDEVEIRRIIRELNERK